MVAVLSRHTHSTIISIYNVVSGMHMHDIVHRIRTTNPDLDLGVPFTYKLWTHGELLRFASAEPTTITIWETGFTSSATPTEVENISIPEINNTVETFVFNPSGRRAEFHPALYRLAFTDTDGTLLVLDARASKFLLRHTPTNRFTSMTFSSDGRFFACATVESEVYLWSPTG
jgi:WD40 repeat protein